LDNSKNTQDQTIVTTTPFSSIRALAAGLGTTGLALASAALLAGLPVAAQNATPNAATPGAVQSADNPLGIPSDFNVYGDDTPGSRSATAVVNGYVITGTDIDQRVALVTNASEAEVSEEELQRLRVQVLRNLIDETLKIQAARAQEMGVEPAEVEQTYQQLAAQNFGQEASRMDDYLASIASSPAALKRQIEGELAWENLIRRNISPFINVSAEEVTDTLERLEQSRGTEEYRLGEIYMGATAETRDAVIQNMQRVMQQLEQGGSFVAYARQFSEATTAVVGGDTGYLRLGTLPQAMADQVRQMQPGQLAGPVAIPGGFTIVYLIDKRQVLTADPRDALLNLKQISIELPEGIGEQEAQARIDAFGTFVGTLRSCSEADNAAASFGASVVTNDQIQARQLPEQLQAILLDLQVGQTTPPFGTAQDGVRVLMLCGRDDPEDAGAPTFQSVMNSLEQERIDKRAQRYLRDLRNDAYIEYN
jgi:peptidyl-prolyl cis-trans isomerase SurA